MSYMVSNLPYRQSDRLYGVIGSVISLELSPISQSFFSKIPIWLCASIKIITETITETIIETKNINNSAKKLHHMEFFVGGLRKDSSNRSPFSHGALHG